ncbi:sialin-like isoform X1 [Portunus trituberculatus]|uniref:sialin-like isoform X1 n=2 Tax=Portunus trituberculatus TaxID=210409 RepID=UPI001E1D1F5F|nr:sialin-like isoform X1 [Portunus trituberculatus]XP_045139173.1 sialin-like isoform X1 [Portunus trituberculatus]XP_045139174.1 sialin-like isoform X1 [Portunus trituberculatus]
MTTTPEPNEETPFLSFPSVRTRINPRHTLALLGCLGLAVDYCQRVNLSVAIVAMVKPSRDNTSHSCPYAFYHSSNVHAFPQSHGNYSTQMIAMTEAMQWVRGGKEFSWDKWTQGLVLGSFYWGYAVTSVFGGRISDYLGGKTVMGLGVFAASFLTLMTPLAACASVQALVITRIFLGIAQGITIPAMNTILASWFLPTERIKYTALIMSGCQVGAAVGMTFSGLLADSFLLHGWPSVFYFFGAVGIVWSMTWCFLVYSQPEDHPGVSPELLSRLQENQHSVKQREVVQIPWKSLASSLPLWGVVLAGLGNDYGFYTFLADLPTYLNDVHHLHITSIGLLSALPFLLMLLWSLAWGALMHTLSKRNFVSLVTVRRMSMAVAMYGPVVGLMVLMFMQYNMAVTVSMTCLVVMLNGAASSGYLSSLQDLAPNLAGTLMGLTNTVGSLAGIGSPALTGYITGESKTEWPWRIVFLIIAVLYFATCTFYLIIISADVQPWNEPQGSLRVHLRYHGRRRSHHQQVPAIHHHLAD